MSGMVRHISENILRDNLSRGETLARDTTLTAAQAATLTRQLAEGTGSTVTEIRLSDGTTASTMGRAH